MATLEQQYVQSPITRNTPYADLPQYMSVAECAAFTGCNAWTIYEGVRRGDIPRLQGAGKLIRIPKEFFHPSRTRITPDVQRSSGGQP